MVTFRPTPLPVLHCIAVCWLIMVTFRPTPLLVLHCIAVCWLIMVTFRPTPLPVLHYIAVCGLIMVTFRPTPLLVLHYIAVCGLTMVKFRPTPLPVLHCIAVCWLIMVIFIRLCPEDSSDIFHQLMPLFKKFFICWDVPVSTLMYSLGVCHFCRSKSVSGSPVGPYLHRSDSILKSTGYLPKKLPCPPIFTWKGRSGIIVILDLQTVQSRFGNQCFIKSKFKQS